MADYNQRIDDILKSYNNFRKLLNYHSISMKNNGWVGSETDFNISALTDFSKVYTDTEWGSNVEGGSASVFDVPMMVKTYFGNKPSYGLTPDIGFTKNVKIGYGITWTETSNGLGDRYWRSICYGNDKYVAVSGFPTGSNIFAYSTDGITWTETSNGLNKRDWCFICYGNNKYVAMAYNSNVFAYSTDGITWTETSNGLSERSWNYICYGNSKYIAVARRATGTDIFAYSTDGVTWIETSNGLNSRDWRSICYGNDKYVATSYSNIFAYSTDGITWTETSNGLSDREWFSICYGNGKYVAIAYGSNIFAYSTDGITWIETSNGLSDRNWYSICYGNGKYVAVARDSNIFAYSTDGITWTETSNGLNSRDWRSICYGNDKYVATSYSNIFAYMGIVLNYIQSDNPDYIEYAIDISSSSSGSKPFEKHRSGFISAASPLSTEKGGTVLFKTEIGSISIYPNVDIPNGNVEDITADPSDPLILPIKNVPYWNDLSIDNIFIVKPNNDHYMHNLAVFASYDKNEGHGGLVLYITTDFIHFNVHNILPETMTAEELHTLLGPILGNRLTNDDSEDVSIMLNCLRKYFHILPNNQYMIMYPYQMYKQEGEYKNTMAVIYSPYQEEPIATINDPYSDNDWQNKATNGISAYLNYNGEFVLYYNNRMNTPLSLGLGSMMNMIKLRSNGDIVNVPRIGKYYNIYPSGEDSLVIDASADKTTFDCAISTLNSKTKDYTDGKFPAAMVSLALDDTKHILDNEESLGDDLDKFKSINLLIPGFNDVNDNIDADISQFINYDNTDTTNDKNLHIWKETSNGLSVRQWFSICYGNGKYVAVAYGSNAFAYSTDGITWIKTSNGLSVRQWQYICYGNGKYVAVSNSNTFAYSTDGITWTETSNGLNSRNWRSICYGNGKYVAIAYNSNTFAYSTDGITWTETSNGLSSQGWSSICYGNNKYVATSASNVFAYSTDGITWKETSNGLNRSWRSICYGNGKYVATSDSNIFIYSTDGITWTETSNGLNSRTWQTICYGNGKYVAVSYNSNTFAYSTDGITWTETSNGLSNRYWWSICYGNGKYVATSTSNVFAYLEDFYKSKIDSNSKLYLNNIQHPNLQDYRIYTTAFGEMLTDNLYKENTPPR